VAVLWPLRLADRRLSRRSRMNQACRGFVARAGIAIHVDGESTPLPRHRA
jgi:hypothetical protein